MLELRDIKKTSGDDKSPLEGMTMTFVLDDESMTGQEFFDSVNDLMESGCGVHFIISVEGQEEKELIEKTINESCNEHSGQYTIDSGDPDVFNKAMKETTDQALNPEKAVEQIVEAVQDSLGGMDDGMTTSSAGIGSIVFNNMPIISAALEADTPMDDIAEWVVTLLEQHENDVGTNLDSMNRNPIS